MVKQPKKSVSYRLSPKHVQVVKHYAEKDEMSQAEVVEAALEQYDRFRYGKAFIEAIHVPLPVEPVPPSLPEGKPRRHRSRAIVSLGEACLRLNLSGPEIERLIVAGKLHTFTRDGKPERFVREAELQAVAADWLKDAVETQEQQRDMEEWKRFSLEGGGS